MEDRNQPGQLGQNPRGLWFRTVHVNSLVVIELVVVDAAHELGRVGCSPGERGIGEVKSRVLFGTRETKSHASPNRVRSCPRKCTPKAQSHATTDNNITTPHRAEDAVNAGTSTGVNSQPTRVRRVALPRAGIVRA